MSRVVRLTSRIPVTRYGGLGHKTNMNRKKPLMQNSSTEHPRNAYRRTGVILIASPTVSTCPRFEFLQIEQASGIIVQNAALVSRGKVGVLNQSKRSRRIELRAAAAE